MRKTLLTAAALGALIAIAPVVAQDYTPPAEAPATDQAAPPATEEAAPPATEEAAPAAEEAAPAVTEETDTTAAADQKFIGQQEETQMLASSLIGSTVYSAADENLGDINDIVMNEDGSIAAVIVGVGGFLGIGEKNVAISFGALTETTDADGNTKIVLDATMEELDAAPSYVTLAQLRQEELDKQNLDAMQPAPPAPAPAP